VSYQYQTSPILWGRDLEAMMSAVTRAVSRAFFFNLNLNLSRREPADNDRDLLWSRVARITAVHRNLRLRLERRLLLTAFIAGQGST
jgi:hypothetical protein